MHPLQKEEFLQTKFPHVKSWCQNVLSKTAKKHSQKMPSKEILGLETYLETKGGIDVMYIDSAGAT